MSRDMPYRPRGWTLRRFDTYADDVWAHATAAQVAMQDGDAHLALDHLANARAALSRARRLAVGGVESMRRTAKRRQTS